MKCEQWFLLLIKTFTQSPQTNVMSNIYSEKDVIEQIETRNFLLKNL